MVHQLGRVVATDVSRNAHQRPSCARVQGNAPPCQPCGENPRSLFNGPGGTQTLAENSQKTENPVDRGANCGAFSQQAHASTTEQPQQPEHDATLAHSAPCTPTDESNEDTTIDPNLARVIDAWPQLSAPIRAGILAMIAASSLTTRL
jgi:hypothetical protein